MTISTLFRSAVGNLSGPSRALELALTGGGVDIPLAALSIAVWKLEV
jgi:hypothetical protein